MTILGDDESNILTGTASADTIDAKGGNDILIGLDGNDALYGGSGDDTYEFSGTFSVFNSWDRIWELADGGTDDMIHIITGPNVGDIPASAVRIVGRAQYFDPDSVQIIVDGFGTIHLNSQLLDPKVEWLKIGDNDPISLTGGLNMTGSSSSEDIKGSKFNDTINGMGGNENLYGGLGSDTYEFSGTFSVFNNWDRIWELADGGTDDTIHIITGPNIGDIPASAVRIVGRAQYFDPDSVQIIVDGFGTIHLNSQLLDPKVEWLKIGNAAPISLTGGLTMTGSSFGEAIKGTKYNDAINGKGGSDSLRGGLGNDTYIVDNVGVVITENVNEGTDTVKSSISLTLPLNVENLTLTGALAINGTGNDLNNKLTGNSAANQLNGGLGNDTLDGKGGIDTLIGGLGNDSYVVDSTADVVTENLNEGTDKVSSNATFTLPDNVENLTLTGASAINGNGNGLANNLVGNSAANQLKGNGGSDTLDGKTGNNTLTGGGGQDTFKLTTAGHIDSITDFIVVDDTIQLENAVFTALTTPGTLAASQFKIGAQASDLDDFIIYNSVSGALLYDADGSGAGAAVQIATLTAGLAMTNADLVVI